MNYLAPLLPSDVQPGNLPITVPGEEGAFVAMPGGILSPADMQVKKDPATGQPVALSAPDERALKRYASKCGFQVQMLPPTPPANSVRVDHNGLLLSAALECAVCKSALLTFDGILGHSPERFTRSPELARVRELVRDAAFGGAPTEFSREIAWGLDYSLPGRILELLASDGQPNIEPFAHALIAVGKPVERTVTLAWLVLGFEPYRFCLSRKWSGPAFCHVVVSGILRDSTTTLKSYASDFFIGPPSPLRATSERGACEETLKARMDQIGRYRIRAYQDATELVEMRCDEIVQKGICSFAGLRAGEVGQSQTVANCMEERLRYMYEDRLATAEAQKHFSEVVASHITVIPWEERSKTIVYGDYRAAHVGWPRWIEADRAIIKQLKSRFGPPGAMQGNVTVLERPS
jgi:hypothetical protein